MKNLNNLTISFKSGDSLEYVIASAPSGTSEITIDCSSFCGNTIEVTSPFSLTRTITLTNKNLAPVMIKGSPLTLSDPSISLSFIGNFILNLPIVSDTTVATATINSTSGTLSCIGNQFLGVRLFSLENATLAFLPDGASSSISLCGNIQSIGDTQLIIHPSVDLVVNPYNTAIECSTIELLIASATSYGCIHSPVPITISAPNLAPVRLKVTQLHPSSAPLTIPVFQGTTGHPPIWSPTFNLEEGKLSLQFIKNSIYYINYTN